MNSSVLVTAKVSWPVVAVGALSRHAHYNDV